MARLILRKAMKLMKAAGPMRAARPENWPIMIGPPSSRGDAWPVTS